MIHTVIIDTKQEDREKTKNLLALHKDFDIRGLGKDGYDALRLITSFKPDIAILDVNLDLINGIDVLPLLKRQSPATLMVILASKIDDNQISKALSNKIAGFLLKDSDLGRLPSILKDLLGGKYYMNPLVSARVFHIFHEISHKGRSKNFLQKRIYPIPEGISKTELQIMSCIGEGRSDKEIAEYLSLKEGTVRNYISSTIHKTGLRDRTRMAIYALITGLTNSDNLWLTGS
jgi:DNA-binding NarL/FixJ family response regulator